MDAIKSTFEFGLIIRKQALNEKSISLNSLMKTMQTDEPLDMNSDLISFGPHFGKEALDFFTQELINLNLNYFDDFFELVMPTPEWCLFRAELKNEFDSPPK